MSIFLSRTSPTLKSVARTAPSRIVLVRNDCGDRRALLTRRTLTQQATSPLLLQQQQARFFSKESSSATELHSQVSQTLQPPQPPPSPPPPTDAPPRGVAQQIFRHQDRRARYNQAVWNAGAAFMLMLMAAQSLKSSRERKRVAATLGDVEATSAQRLAVLRSLLQEETIQDLVQEIVQVQQQSTDSTVSTTSWFGGKSSPSSTVMTEAQKQQLTVAVWNKMQTLVADVALDEAEQVTLNMRLQEIQDSIGSTSTSTTAPQVATTTTTTEPTTVEAVPKRVPFTM